MNEKSLDLNEEKIEYVYDVYDTNAINFWTDAGGYFCIQRGAAIDPEDDPSYNEPHIELNGQAYGDYYNIRKVLFSRRRICVFPEKRFLKEYDCVRINLSADIDVQMVDFFVNHLFLGDVVDYSEDMDPSFRIKQTEFPMILGE